MIFGSMAARIYEPPFCDEVCTTNKVSDTITLIEALQPVS